MGICNSDPLGYLIKQYGTDVCKYIVSLKAEDFIDKTSPKFVQRVQQQFKNSTKSLDKQFDSKQATVKNNFESVVSSIKQSSPQSIQKAKTSQGKTQEQLFGYDSIKNQFGKLKNAKDDKLKELQAGIMKKITENKDSLKRNVQQSRPSLPLFDSMPLCIKQKVLSQGEQRFAPQIKSKQEEILGVFEKITNVGNLQSDIKNAAGLNQADKLIKDSNSTFQKAKKIITMMQNPSRSCFG